MQLLDTEFIVARQMKVNRKWMFEYPDWAGFGDGNLIMLAPLCPGELNLVGLSAVATIPNGKEVSLAFDKVVVNESGCISLFFEGKAGVTIPDGSKVRFAKVSEEVAKMPPTTQYWINIGGIPATPLTKEELFAKYGDRISADTPCSRVGENKWRIVSDYFPDRRSPSPNAEAERVASIICKRKAIETGGRFLKGFKLIVYGAMGLVGFAINASNGNWWIAIPILFITCGALILGIWLTCKGKKDIL